MAVTRGHGNPRWNREETILAYRLFSKFGDKLPGPDNEEVKALSVQLRSLSLHPGAAERETFRNAAGVAFKIKNLHAVITGKGLQNVSAMDRIICAEFAGRPELLTRPKPTSAKYSVNSEIDDEVSEFDVFPEGKSKTIEHLSRERNTNLRKRVLRYYRKAGLLSCQLCNFESPFPDNPLFDSIFEAHHLVPLSLTQETQTRLKDMTLLCACCHRFVHGATALSKRWLTMEELGLLRLGQPIQAL